MWFFKKKAPPYTLSTQHFAEESPISYKLFDGVRVSDQKEFSIFEIKADSSPLQQTLAQNAIKIWKTFRHPAIPLFIESYENEGANYIVTDKLLPFDDRKLSDSELSWAIYVMCDFVGFLGEDANAIHGNIQSNSLFMTYGHELKISGLHWMTVNGAGPIRDYNSDWCRCCPSYIQPQPPTDAPTYSIDVRFIGSFLNQWDSKLPKTITKFSKRWTANVRNPPSPKSLLAADYWKTDKFMLTLLFLRDLPLKDQFDRENFFKNLLETINVFSVETQEFTILPLLLSALSFAQTPAVLEIILAIGLNMGAESFGQKVVPSLLPLFESKDRSIRIHLLSQMEKLLPHFTPKIINDNIFTNVVLGLNDTVTALKASTIIAMVPLAPHLSINNGKTLLRELKRLQADPDSSIRCNSVICLAKIAEHIEAEFRISALIGCFGKAAVDSFAPCRKAAISAYRSCASYFNQTIVATSIMPVLSPLCIDQNLEIRAMAIKTMKEYIEDLSKDIPENYETEKVDRSEKADVPISNNKSVRTSTKQSTSLPETRKTPPTRALNSSPSSKTQNIKNNDTHGDYSNNENDDGDDDDWGEPIIVKKPQNPLQNKQKQPQQSQQANILLNTKNKNGTISKSKKDDDDDDWGEPKPIKVKQTLPQKPQKPAPKVAIIDEKDGWSDDLDSDDINEDINQDKSNNNNNNSKGKNAFNDDIDWGTPGNTNKNPIRASNKAQHQPKTDVVSNITTTTKGASNLSVNSQSASNAVNSKNNKPLIPPKKVNLDSNNNNNKNSISNNNNNNNDSNDEDWGEPKTIQQPKVVVRQQQLQTTSSSTAASLTKAAVKQKISDDEDDEEQQQMSAKKPVVRVVKDDVTRSSLAAERKRTPASTTRGKKVIVQKVSDGWDDDIDWDEED